MTQHLTITARSDDPESPITDLANMLYDAIDELDQDINAEQPPALPLVVDLDSDYGHMTIEVRDV
ncbi:MAG: hypothetical protein KKB13_18760 [Chloroflexi bacterium]|nr:hypothetical protein [Chloroflexota bacterium]